MSNVNAEMRPLPILMRHFPSAPAIDFTDVHQRMLIRCSCGEVFRDRESSRVMEAWAHHAMDGIHTGGGGV